MTRLAALALASLVLAAAAPARAAESYQPVRVDVTAFGAYSSSADIAAWGGGGAVEVKYNALDQLAVGLRFEGAGFVSQSVKVGGDGSSTSVEQGGRGVSAYLAKADWYLTTSSVRPFVGVGAGLYKIGAGSQSVNTGSGSATVVQTASSFEGFGIAPQLGVNFGGFRMAVLYHLIGGGDMVTVTQVVGQPEARVTLPKNYVAFELGGTIGGRRRVGAQ